ncbi:acyltransferase family protein [Krasilnikoviella flava]|uniref:Peptidoglycan/LPS O-acetylase OafA/YrhL, contains acyltransferase and SGNH-hydrolase domains n=1 Tax=Krasilnikoviella flava TaxID=526729 RepID=A0A1T5I9Z6_9MICO|nr:acyltransferase family protein [Krasilnikoviella flava]SKC35863.1 Peptidoglycan/LPS O-acetylase OafA/YrhL, contains acyltransferase and SGNH-hydrolase domains [Krasilnikoviella flava]
MSAPVGAPERVTAPAAAPTHVRTDVQGLRALAVSAVLVYHLLPGTVTGGYVGVDVFFVISGFLITSHLLRRPVRGVRDLLEFWARRVRRLIPAATVVLLATLAATLLWLPTTVHARVARDVAAAALYVENWSLARSATDYLAAEELASPVQHYWSLSVEEQFYVVWPVLVGLTVWLAVRLRRRGTGFSTWLPTAVVGLVVVVSLAWSVHLTATNPAAAYFVTTTRLWELALGGLVAAAVTVRPWRLSAPVRATLAWAGLAAVLAAVVLLDGSTPFPGVAAALPTVGAALVIAAAADGARGGPGGLLALRPVQWLGDVSYSVYLWHWPLIVVVPYVLGRALGAAELVGVVLASLLLAAATKRWVEDPLRRQPLLVRRRAATFGLLAVCVGVTAVWGLSTASTAEAREREAIAAAPANVAAAGECAGAGAVRDPSCDVRGLLTPPEAAAQDEPDVYADGCWNDPPFTTRNSCSYGSDDAPLRIAVLGNSHAGHWTPALEAGEVAGDWQVDTYLQSSCYPVERLLEYEAAADAQGCLDTTRWATDSITGGGYDLVVVSARTNQLLADVPEDQQADVAQDAYADTLATFTDAGLPVLVLRDTPAMPDSVPDCLATGPVAWDDCGAPPSQALEPDPLAAAARADSSGLVTAREVTDLMCDEEVCHPVIGGVVAYFDHGHLTATFARTLTPEVTEGVRAALGTRPG